MSVILLELLPFNTPPQDPEYQYQFAPVPRTPPFLVTSAPDPMHIVPGNTVIESEETEFVFSAIIVLLHAVVLHVPWALT